MIDLGRNTTHDYLRLDGVEIIVIVLFVFQESGIS